MREGEKIKRPILTRVESKTTVTQAQGEAHLYDRRTESSLISNFFRKA